MAHADDILLLRTDADSRVSEAAIQLRLFIL